MSSSHTLRLGTRGSLLARMQSQLVADALEKRHAGLRVEVRVFSTMGDRVTDRPLHDVGGKGLFTKELELALLAGEIDFAVHSYKDVPVTMPLVDTSDLVIAATPTREDPRDVLMTRPRPRERPAPSPVPTAALSSVAPTSANGLPDLAPEARIGTGSLRRRCQLLQLRPDLKILPIRGNIDTRLRKLAEGEFDGVILALAGLRRSGLFDEDFMTCFDPGQLLPAPAQGALALQCRAQDGVTRGWLHALHDPLTQCCVDAERKIVLLLGGDCHSPIGALATLQGQTLRLRAKVGARDGVPPVIQAEAAGHPERADQVVGEVYEALERQNVERLLRDGR